MNKRQERNIEKERWKNERGRNFVEKQKRRSEGTKIYRRLKKECGEIFKVLNLQQVNPVGRTKFPQVVRIIYFAFMIRRQVSCLVY